MRAPLSKSACPFHWLNSFPSFFFKLAADTVCTIKDKDGVIVFREELSKGDMLLAAPTFAARNPLQYQNPDKFQPHHFDTIPITLPWFPFGEGMHTCPGQWLLRKH